MRRVPHSRERGSAILVMLIVLTALGTIAGLTVISVQGGSATTNTQRFSAMALYAAESGAAAAMEFLRDRVVAGSPPKFNGFPVGATPFVPSSGQVHGNGVQPGAPGNLLSIDQQGWYEVALLNNRGDPGMATSNDTDGVVIIQVTGHGPNGAIKKLEWEVATTDGIPSNPLTLLGWRDTF